MRNPRGAPRIPRGRNRRGSPRRALRVGKPDIDEAGNPVLTDAEWNEMIQREAIALVEASLTNT
jgi:hypothetical protein